ncbi:protein STRICTOSIDINE SYNTHASE-LIKE 4-like [Dioscorea cayenensis subsp. rotundata]|uniref:Protein STRICTOSIDINE SYNTHASE-LIKE 4-like n=1 Tax=Dioscorea cayennensis subsp. rotundata TaxID=55577 RepID=A0AB40D140_DIOCR|nr:protein STRICTOSIDINE SYNTHASE-LIKE 4-like [Dioscorea cayenensis subsp. rotundata]
MTLLVFTITTSVLTLFLAFIFHAILYSPISPQPLLIPSSQPPSSNNILQKVEKLGEGELLGPEDVAIGKDGDSLFLYTVTRDGWLKRMHSNGTWESWKMIGGDGLLGITVSMDGGFLVCDAHKGLLKVAEGGVVVLASQVDDDGSQIRFADAVIEAKDGSIYFSDASTKFGFHEWYLDALEARPHGRLLKFNPHTNTTSILVSQLYFANGVALSKDQDFLLVCETFRFRCMRYWLKGELEGKLDVFIDNLPGAPDNINLAPDGSFWIALLQLRRRGLDWIHKWSLVKKMISVHPSLVEMLKGSAYRRVMVVNVASNGTFISALDDSTGRIMSFVTSALEFDGHLYFGSLHNNFIGKIIFRLIYH